MEAAAADWDLNAVVRRCSTASTSTSAAAAVPTADDFMHGRVGTNHNNVPHFVQNYHQHPFCGLIHFGKPQNGGDDPFDELGKIISPYSHSMPDFSNPNSEIHQLALNQSQFLDQTPVPCPVMDTNNPAPRSRKRKNQQAKVVIRVRSEALPGDSIWAWRKYGQKPIKGSPYPRSYYRCSSTTDCVAKKQVEQHPSGEDLYIITYTGIHSHPRPTHRNSLAGSTRIKHSHATASTSDATKKSGNDIANPSLIDLSPTTPLITAPTVVKEVNGEDDDVDEMEGEDNDEDDILIPNIVAMNEDIFLGLKELGREIPKSAAAMFRRRPPRFPPPVAD